MWLSTKDVCARISITWGDFKTDLSYQISTITKLKAVFIIFVSEIQKIFAGMMKSHLGSARTFLSLALNSLFSRLTVNSWVQTDQYCTDNILQGFGKVGEH